MWATSLYVQLLNPRYIGTMDLEASVSMGTTKSSPARLGSNCIAEHFDLNTIYVRFCVYFLLIQKSNAYHRLFQKNYPMIIALDMKSSP